MKTMKISRKDLDRFASRDLVLENMRLKSECMRLMDRSV